MCSWKSGCQQFHEIIEKNVQQNLNNTSSHLKLSTRACNPSPPDSCTPVFRTSSWSRARCPPPAAPPDQSQWSGGCSRPGGWRTWCWKAWDQDEELLDCGWSGRLEQSENSIFICIFIFPFIVSDFFFFLTRNWLFAMCNKNSDWIENWLCIYPLIQDETANQRFSKKNILCPTCLIKIWHFLSVRL